MSFPVTDKKGYEFEVKKRYIYMCMYVYKYINIADS